jgi:glycosyltransferase involved in cell wall biosynthesis
VMKRLAIISTHPIQYYAPVFKLLAGYFNLHVFYSGGKQLVNQYDQGFKRQITWDISLLDGYEHSFLPNTSKDAGSHHFRGIINPTAVNEIKAFAPDAILIYGWANQSHFKIIRHFKNKVPVYFRGDSNLLDRTTGYKNSLKTIFLRWLYKNIDAAFYVGKANKAYYEKYGLKEKQLIFAPHSIDNERFSTDRSKEANQIREELAIKSDETVILFAGKLEPKKSPDLLLKAFTTLELNDRHLIFVGNGVLETDLKTQASKSGLKNIHFLDFQNQSKMPAIYQACDLFCLPSAGPGETWGLAVNEAMASGRAVLVSDKVGCAIDLVKKENGAIFKNNNMEDLKQKLIDLTANKSMLNQMGKCALQDIKDWSFEQQVNAIVKYVNR